MIIMPTNSVLLLRSVFVETTVIRRYNKYCFKCFVDLSRLRSNLLVIITSLLAVFGENVDSKGLILKCGFAINQ
jgi:hypothetical protein